MRGHQALLSFAVAVLLVAAPCTVVRVRAAEPVVLNKTEVGETVKGFIKRYEPKGTSGPFFVATDGKWVDAAVTWLDGFAIDPDYLDGQGEEGKASKDGSTRDKATVNLRKYNGWCVVRYAPAAAPQTATHELLHAYHFSIGSSADKDVTGGAEEVTNNFFEMVNTMRRLDDKLEAIIELMRKGEPYEGQLKAFMDMFDRRRKDYEAYSAETKQCIANIGGKADFDGLLAAYNAKIEQAKKGAPAVGKRTDAAGVGKPATYPFKVRPGAWTDTGIQLSKGQSVDLTAKGQITDGKEFKISPDGYYHLGFQAWTFKAKLGKRIIDVGSRGSVSATEDSQLLIGVTYTYEPGPDDGKLSGEFEVTATGTGLKVDAMIAAAGGKRVGGAASDGGGGGGGDPFRNQGSKELIAACPVTVVITDGQGHRAGAGPDGKVVSDISGLILEAKPDGAGGNQWYVSLPKGDFTASFTGTDKGLVHVRTKQQGKAEMAYPPLNVEKGSTASLKLTDSAEAQPLRTGTTELTPTVAREGGAVAGGGPGGSGSAQPGNVSAGKNLVVSRSATFRKVTDFPRGEGAQIVGPSKMSSDGSRVVFGTNQGVYVMNSDGSELKKVAGGTPVTLIDISADGKKIAWFQRGEKSALFTANADGSDATPMPLNGISIANAIRLTADGSRLFAVAYEKAGIYVMPTDGSDLKRVVDTAAVCKLLKIDENSNHWRNVLEVSDDGSRLAFHLLWTVFGINGDGTGLHVIADRKQFGINGVSLSANGAVVAIHDSGDPATAGITFADFGGRELLRFKTRSEDIWSMAISGDGGQVYMSPGLRVFNGDGKTYYDPCDVGTNLWANPLLIGVSRDGSRACLRIDGPESTDQGRPHQFVLVQLKGSGSVGVPAVTGVSVMPKFVLADGNSNATVTLKTSTPEPRSVGAAMVVNGCRPPNMANIWFGMNAMNAKGEGGDAAKADGTYTSAAVNARTYDGKPLPAGPIGLRVHVLDKEWNLTVVDLDGLEVRTP